MREINLNKYKKEWQSTQGFNSEQLTEIDIQKLLKKKSKDIVKLFSVGLRIDSFLKSSIAIALVALFFFFELSQQTKTITVILLTLDITSVFFQIRSFSLLPKTDYSQEKIRESLKKKIDFYYSHFRKSLAIGAFSNVLIFLTGMLYYFQIKYGEIRKFEIDDYIVFASACILSFVIGYFIQIKHHKFQIRQLEECLDEIDSETISAHSEENRRQKRRKIFLIISISIVFGLLLLSYFIFK